MKRQEIETILQLYKNKKMNRAELMKKYNLKYNSLYRLIKKRGIKFWDDQKSKKSQHGLICRLYRKRIYKINELAGLFGYNVETIKIILRNNGIKLWDKNKKNKHRESKYFDWQELKNHPMCQYNLNINNSYRR